MSYLAKIGVEKERRLKVATNQTTSFLWDGENVLSTPSMISEMEETCRLLVKEECIVDSEWDSVGTLVNVKHLVCYSSWCRDCSEGQNRFFRREESIV